MTFPGISFCADSPVPLSANTPKERVIQIRGRTRGKTSIEVKSMSLRGAAPRIWVQTRIPQLD